jgi:L-threonylcarbamoyladenylate synthase
VSRVVQVDPARPDEAAIAAAAQALREGRLVAFPTETVYGLGAAALNPRAIARVFAAKGRPTTHPLIAHVADEAGARGMAAAWPERASRLARAFWPGPLTLIVARAVHVPAELTGGADSVAIRAPAHPVARALIAAFGAPVAAPSANRYQEISPTTAAHVAKSLGDEVAMILDGGACERGIESTVVDVRGDTAIVLRPGPIGVDALRAIVPSVVLGPRVARDGDRRASPGMDAKHYAPRARVVVAGSWPEAEQTACGLVAAGVKVGLVLHSRRTSELASSLSRSPRVFLRDLPHDAPGYARGFFAALHDMDDHGVDAIVIEEVPTGEAWWAVADRVRRAAGG